VIELLHHYAHLWRNQPWWQHDSATLERMAEFFTSSPEVFQRSHAPGHFTGSALVCDRSLERVALLHHRKLNKWLQFGGHADGDPELARVALKEAEEESGLQRLMYLEFEEALGQSAHPLPFDLDIHAIPARGDDPEHLHYDVRYLLWCPDQPLKGNEESHQVAWFRLEEARQVTQEPSMLRQFEKLELLRGLFQALAQNSLDQSLAKQA
jgi:8-oxo-dGTP pyrophosphatase MutT (NUDIX family)